MYTVRLFMWGYQGPFRISVQTRAKALFQTLHPQFEVETFLLGIANEGMTDVHPVCLEPENCGFSPADFENVRTAASHHQALDPERDLICMAETHQRSHDNRLTARAWRNAVLDILNGWRKQGPGQYYFLGSVPVDKHQVGIVLRLTCQAKDPLYNLPKVHAEERFSAFHSLVEATVYEFLADCTDAVSVSSPTQVISCKDLNPNELLREAGRRFMQTPVWAGSDQEWLYGLFDSCNQISEMTYESEGTVGRMLVARADRENGRHKLTLTSPVSLGEGRRVRKLLQVAATKDSLLCDGSNVIGFGHLEGDYDQVRADLFEVRFTRQHRWELLHANRCLMQVRYGVPTLPRPPLDREKLASDLVRVFPGLSPDASNRLVVLALETCRQRHGALLVISTQAETEAARLVTQSTLIKPTLLTEEILASVTAIDGAVLMSPDGICHAIGVILDGVATAKGDPARGARYNSSVRYIEGKSGCLAVVVSEDGSAEWFPNLMPRISRIVLEGKRGETDRLLAEDALDLDQARGLLQWLSGHRFYLAAEFCHAANRLLGRYAETAQQAGTFSIVYAAFVPSSEMTSEYVKE